MASFTDPLEIRGHRIKHRLLMSAMTTSRAEQDVLRSYALHANCYITKPVDFNQFLEVVKSIEHFWLAVVTLPKES